MTRRKFQAMNQNYSKVRSGLSLIVCLLLSTAYGLPQVYKVPQWIHQRSPNGVVHVFFMHHEPLLMNNWFPDNLVDKELSRTFSAFTDNDSNEPKVERFYHKLLIDIGKSPLSSLKEHNRIQTQRRQEEIQWIPNKNKTTAEETMKRLKRQVTGKYNNGSNTTTSIPTKINERKQDDSFLPPNILDGNNTNTSNYKSNTALPTMYDSPVDTSNISAVSNTTITEPEILAKAINDEEYVGDEDRDILRTFLQSITVNPDDMEPRETQDIITNGDIVTALVFPMFLILMIGTTIYIVQKFRSNYMQRWQGHRRHPRPPVSNIPLDNITPINKVKPNGMDKTEKTEETDEEELPETKKSPETVSVYNIGYMPQSQSFLQILDEIENPAVPKESNIYRTQLVPQKSRNILSAPISDEYDTIPKESCIPSTICTTLNELVTKPSAKEPQTESDLNLKVQLVPNKSSNILSDLIEPNKHDANRGASFIRSNTPNILNEVDRKPNGQEPRTDSITIPKTSHDSMKSNVKISTTNVLNAITKPSSTNEFKEPDGKRSATEVMVLDESLIKPFSFED